MAVHERQRVSLEDEKELNRHKGMTVGIIPH